MEGIKFRAYIGRGSKSLGPGAHMGEGGSELGIFPSPKAYTGGEAVIVSRASGKMKKKPL